MNDRIVLKMSDLLIFVLKNLLLLNHPVRVPLVFKLMLRSLSNKTPYEVSETVFGPRCQCSLSQEQREQTVYNRHKEMSACELFRGQRGFR